MTKFLVTYMGSESGVQPDLISEDQRQAFMQCWADWAAANKQAIVDDGAPVGKTLLVTPDAISPTKNSIVGYTIVEADSHEAAAEIFRTHPHVAILNHPIEVMVCPPVPGM